MIDEEPSDDSVKALLEQMERVVWRINYQTNASPYEVSREDAEIYWSDESPTRGLGFVPDGGWPSTVVLSKD